LDASLNRSTAYLGGLSDELERKKANASNRKGTGWTLCSAAQPIFIGLSDG